MMTCSGCKVYVFNCGNRIRRRVNRVLRKRVYFMLVILLFVIVTLFYYEDYCRFNCSTYRRQEPQKDKIADTKYLVSSSKCKIVALDAFNSEAMQFFQPATYVPCTNLTLLTYVTKQDNIAILHINKTIMSSYATDGVFCCYSNVTRARTILDVDDTITISECQLFQNDVILYHDTVIVECTDINNALIYENVHSVFLVSEDVQKKMDKVDNTTRHISVLFVGIDSVSRLNFIRSLPRTYTYVENNHWLSLKGYNKMDDNTFPNLMAILTGFNDTYACDICNPTEVGKLDACPMLWYDYRKLGYITSYAEDEAWMNTFNYKKKGFDSPPTDYYFRPYILATEQLNKELRNGMTYCTGPENSGERVMNLAKEFAVTFKNYPTFGFYWMNSFSHNDVNSVSAMDNKTKEFLEDLAINGVLENTIVIFFSDHGVRFGDIRLTKTGWSEERLPFIYFSFPKWFQKEYRNEFMNFKNNSYKLTSPYDIYLTLQHILVLSGHKYRITPSNGCPTCKSLFQHIDSERSCEEAGIEQHWCTCSAYTSTKLGKSLERKITNYVLREIHAIIISENGSELCERFSVKNIIGTSLSQKFLYKNDTYILLSFETSPKAIFESTIHFENDISSLDFSISGSISRLDRYSDTSYCVKNTELKKYCYCVDFPKNETENDLSLLKRLGQYLRVL